MIHRMNYGTGRRCGRDIDPHGTGMDIARTDAYMLAYPPLRKTSRMHFSKLPPGLYDLTPPRAVTAEHRIKVFTNGTARYQMRPLRPNEAGERVTNTIEMPHDRVTVAITERRLGGLILFDMLTHLPGPSPLESDDEMLNQIEGLRDFGDSDEFPEIW